MPYCKGLVKQFKKICAHSFEHYTIPHSPVDKRHKERAVHAGYEFEKAYHILKTRRYGKIPKNFQTW